MGERDAWSVYDLVHGYNDEKNFEEQGSDSSLPLGTCVSTCELARV